MVEPLQLVRPSPAAAAHEGAAARRPKRVAIDAHVLTGEYQGSRTYLENVLRCIGTLDTANTYLIYSYDPAATRKLLDFPNFEHLRITTRAPVPRLLLFWSRAKREQRFDVLLTQYISPPFVPGTQFVVMHDILPATHPHLFPRLFRWRSQLMFWLTARRADAIFVVSDYTRSQIVERFRIPAARVHLTYNGYDTSADAPAERQARTVGDYVLYVGRLERRKNVDLIVEALKHVRIDGVRLVVVAQRDFADPRLLDLVTHAANVEHRVNVDNRELDQLYRGARALVYPSAAEGFGLPILEALARGVPVITSDRTSLPEVGGAFARYVDPTAPDAATRLATLIEECCTSPPAMHPAALAAHIGKFSWQRSARTIVGQIDRLP